MAKSKIVGANKKIEDAVVGGYKKMENGVVGGFNKMTDKFMDNFLTKDGETLEEAKKEYRMSRRCAKGDVSMIGNNTIQNQGIKGQKYTRAVS